MTNKFLHSGVLAVIGPGLVVAGSVMGAGELINTPVQAAKFGFVLLWAVLVSCVIKYFLQVEIGRHVIVHNRTTIEALNHCPGPKFFNTSWIGLAYMAGYIVSMVTMAGIIGALAGMMHSIAPIGDLSEATSAKIWAGLLVGATIVLLSSGLYSHLELLVALLVGGFSVSVVAAVLLLQGTPYRITWEALGSGLTFSLGSDHRMAAVAVVSLMGALGTTANELFMYPYWLLERGRAAALGDPESAGWQDRLRTSYKSLLIDVGFSTTLATLTTAAFFLLGAAVLHGQGKPPEGLQVVRQISRVYTESYGAWSQMVFYAGAFCTLYSTLVVVGAASGRMGTDLLSSMGRLDRRDEWAVRRSHQFIQTAWLVGLLVLHLLVPKEPKALVIFGQWFVGAYCTPLLIFGICWLALHTDRRARMGWLATVVLLTTALILVTCILVGLLIPLLSNPASSSPGH